MPPVYHKVPRSGSSRRPVGDSGLTGGGPRSILHLQCNYNYRIAITARRAVAGMVETGRLFVKSLAKGMRLLEAFSPGRSRLTLTELSAVTGMNLATVQRLTHTLVSLDYLGRDRHKRFFPLPPGARSGPGILRRLGAQAHGRAPFGALLAPPGLHREPFGAGGRRGGYPLPPRGGALFQDRRAGGIAPARLLHLHGQAFAGRPARGRAQRPAGGPEAGAAHRLHHHRPSGPQGEPGGHPPHLPGRERPRGLPGPAFPGRAGAGLPESGGRGHQRVAAGGDGGAGPGKASAELLAQGRQLSSLMGHKGPYPALGPEHGPLH